MADEEEKKQDLDAINLKVVTQDGNEIFFKVITAPPPHPGRPLPILPPLPSHSPACLRVCLWGPLSHPSDAALALCAQCKQTTPLEKLMRAFCQRQGVQMNAVRFLFDGTRVRDSQTPKDVSHRAPPTPPHPTHPPSLLIRCWIDAAAPSLGSHC